MSEPAIRVQLLDENGKPVVTGQRMVDFAKHEDSLQGAIRDFQHMLMHCYLTMLKSEKTET